MVFCDGSQEWLKQISYDIGRYVSSISLCSKWNRGRRNGIITCVLNPTILSFWKSYFEPMSWRMILKTKQNKQSIKHCGYNDYFKLSPETIHIIRCVFIVTFISSLQLVSKWYTRIYLVGAHSFPGASIHQ